MNLDAIHQSYQRALEWLVVILMAALAGEVTVGVVFRTLGESLEWYDEVASILLAWLTFYGSALASVKRGISAARKSWRCCRASPSSCSG